MNVKFSLIAKVLLPVWIALLSWSCGKESKQVVPDPKPAEEVLTDQAKARTGVELTPQEEYEKFTLYVPKSFQGGRTLDVTNADLTSVMPPVGDQGMQGSCNAFATVHAIGSYLFNLENKISYRNADGSVNTSGILSPAYVYNQINDGKDLGSRPENAFRLMQLEGVCTLKDMPYNAADYLTKPSAAQKASAAPNKLFGWGRTVISTNNFKACINEGIPVYIIVNAGGVQETPSTLVGSERVWNSFDEAKASIFKFHAVVIVGFDDKKNAFKVMNSWGESWGNKGFIWLDYNLVQERIPESYIAFSSSIKPKVVEYKENAVQTNAGTWKSVTGLPEYYLNENVRFTIENEIYFVGYKKNSKETIYELLAYNSLTNSWTVKGKAPVGDYPYGPEGGGFTIGKKAYVVLSSSGEAKKKVMEYDAEKNAWTEKKNFTLDVEKGVNFKRWNPIAFSHNGKGYYGLNPLSISYTQSENAKGGEIWEYEPTGDTWSKKTQMPIDWIKGGAKGYGVVDGKLFIIYKQSVGSEHRGEMPVYEYDFLTGKWSEKAALLQTFHTAITGTINGKIYVGLRAADIGINTKATNELYSYTPKANKWEMVKASPETKLYAQVGGVVNNKLVVGYSEGTTGYGSAWWQYTP